MGGAWRDWSALKTAESSRRRSPVPVSRASWMFARSWLTFDIKELYHE